MSLRRFGLTDLLTCTRASTALVRSAAGVYSSAGNNVLRVSHEGGASCLLAEETRTNSLPRSNVGGAVVGVIGSGGALPTGWSITGIATSAVEVLSIADKNGLPRIRLRINGTPSANVQITFVAVASSPAAAEDQSWASSAFVQMVAGTTTNIDLMRVQFNAYDADNVFLSNRAGDDLKATAAEDLRRAFANTVVGATAAKVSNFLGISWTSGAIDITLDISAPQLEQGAFATSPIITDGTAVTRQGDQIKLNNGLLAQVYGGGPVSVLTEFEAEYVAGGSGTPRVWQIDDGDSGTRISLWPVESASTVTTIVRKDGVNEYNDAEAYTSGAPLKIASRYDADNFATSRNGAVVTTGTGEMTTGLINMGISNQGSSTASNPARLLRLRKLIVYPAALTNAELEALSA